MSDYTPTTEEIREAWKNTLVPKGENTFEFVDPDVAETEFNRWLIQERKRVAEHAKKKHFEHVVDIINELISDAEGHDGECDCRIAAQAYRDLLKHLSEYDDKGEGE